MYECLLCKVFDSFSDDRKTSLVRCVELKDSVAEEFGAKELSTQRQDCRCLACARWAVEEEVWKVGSVDHTAEGLCSMLLGFDFVESPWAILFDPWLHTRSGRFCRFGLRAGCCGCRSSSSTVVEEVRHLVGDRRGLIEASESGGVGSH